jgi:hypothetical protein
MRLRDYLVGPVSHVLTRLMFLVSHIIDSTDTDRVVQDKNYDQVVGLFKLRVGTSRLNVV